VTPLLQQLWQQLSDGRSSADNAARALTGEATPDMSMGGMPAGDMGGMPPEPNAAIPQPGGEEGDAFSATDAAAGGAEELGRDRR